MGKIVRIITVRRSIINISQLTLLNNRCRELSLTERKKLLLVTQGRPL